MKSCFVGMNSTAFFGSSSFACCKAPWPRLNVKQNQMNWLNIKIPWLILFTYFYLSNSHIIIYFTMFRNNYDDCTSTSFITLCVNVSHLLVCFNSSANFVIYLMGGEKFRRVWCETYMCKKGMSSSNGIQRYVYIYLKHRGSSHFTKFLRVILKNNNFPLKGPIVHSVRHWCLVLQ